jgi:hypothetical protein
MTATSEGDTRPLERIAQGHVLGRAALRVRRGNG